MNMEKRDTVKHESEFAYAFRFKKTSSNFNDLWAMKSSARESLRDWLIAWIFTPKTADTCASACSEMIENCIKFSKVGTLSYVSITIEKASIIIETVNDTDPENKESLKKILEAIEEENDLRTLFADRLMTPSQGKSQLGILKIMLETRGAFHLSDVDDAGKVHVRLKIKAKNLA